MMDAGSLAYLVAALAGWGGGAIMAYDPEKYPPTGCKPCPYPAGAIVAAILWALLGINGPIAEVASTAAITGLVGGLFGGSASRFLSSGMARR